MFDQKQLHDSAVLTHSSLPNYHSGGCRGARRGTAVSLELAMGFAIQESPRYLIAGITMGVLGFVMAILPYILRLSLRGPSRARLPATVSELVAQWEHVEARIFFGFQLCASFMILLSWYPFKMQNACCVPAQGGCRLNCFFGSLSWASFRHFFPPIGLLLVACVPTVPQEEYKKLENLVLVAVHCVAAMLMFIGFLMAEAHCLSLRPFQCPFKIAHQSATEYNLRYVLWACAFVCFVLFIVLQAVGGMVELGNVWNVVSFLLECGAGLAMLFNLAVIWKFGSERHMGKAHAKQIGNAIANSNSLNLTKVQGEGRRGTVASLQIAAQQFIQQSSRYVIVGVVLGFTGRFVALVPLLMRMMMFGCHDSRTRLRGTFSEVVSDWYGVEARVFFGFEMTFAFCILVSGYAFQLRNASCIPSGGGCHICLGQNRIASWATFRQFVPPVGLLLIPLVPTVTANEYNETANMVLVLCHSGAFFVKSLGFLAAEAHTLSIPPFRCCSNVVSRASREYTLRFLTWTWCFASLITFIIVSGYVKYTNFKGWDLPNRVLVLSLFLDSSIALAIVGNFWVIWHYSAEHKWSSRDKFLLADSANDSDPNSNGQMTDDLSKKQESGEANATEDPVRALNRRATSLGLSVASEQFLKKSAPFLLLSVVLGISGFFLAVVPLLSKAFIEGLSTEDVPASLAEMVSKWEDTRSRVFFGFELTAAFCLLVSWYPVNMQNGCCIPALDGCKVCSIPWATVRQFFPSVGLMLVVCVPTVPPAASFTAEHFVMMATHRITAVVMFFAYIACEAHTLSIPPFLCTSPVVDRLSREYTWRLRTWLLMAIAYFLFFVTLFYRLSVGRKPLLCVKVFSFLCETIAALAMFFNLLVIWKFASERHWNKLHGDKLAKHQEELELACVPSDHGPPVFETEEVAKLTYPPAPVP